MGIQAKIRRGDSIRIPQWTDCVLEVRDVGEFDIYGKLIDLKTNTVVFSLESFPKEWDWQIVLDAQSFIERA